MDTRPVAHVLGLLMVPMGGAMIPPAILDFLDGAQSWTVFAGGAVIVAALGSIVALATNNSRIASLDIRQAFLLTVSAWAVLPVAGAMPMMFGVPHAEFTNAYFEAMSGMTTTGTTVFEGLDEMPRSILLWRGELQWLGGLGIVIVAFIFLPIMQVGGMQFFKSEGFDTLGKVLPRAADISRELLTIYIALTTACAAAYFAFGMTWFDAIVHSLTTLSTGGFSTSDLSFAKFSGPLEYVSSIFMILASLPFVRFVQLLHGKPTAILVDAQAQTYIRWIAYAIAAVALFRVVTTEGDAEQLFRETVFNIVTLFSGTGYSSADVTTWGSFSLTVILIVGLIGGCTSSTGCSVKVFRWMVTIEAIRVQFARTISPHRIIVPKLGAQKLTEDVIRSVMAFMMFFILTLGLLAVALALTGLESNTAITAAWTAIANVGPAYGPEVSVTGSVDEFPATAKWLMVFGMLLGRLELLSIYVLLVPAFWRA